MYSRKDDIPKSFKLKRTTNMQGKSKQLIMLKTLELFQI